MHSTAAAEKDGALAGGSQRAAAAAQPELLPPTARAAGPHLDILVPPNVLLHGQDIGHDLEGAAGEGMDWAQQQGGAHGLGGAGRRHGSERGAQTGSEASTCMGRTSGWLPPRSPGRGGCSLSGRSPPGCSREGEAATTHHSQPCCSVPAAPPLLTLCPMDSQAPHHTCRCTAPAPERPLLSSPTDRPDRLAHVFTPHSAPTCCCTAPAPGCPRGQTGAP